MLVNTFDDLIGKVEIWADKKNLINASSVDTIDSSGDRVVEAMDVLELAIYDSDSSRTRDGIGSVLVALIVLSTNLTSDLTECLDFAYEEIKDES